MKKKGKTFGKKKIPVQIQVQLWFIFEKVFEKKRNMWNFTWRKFMKAFSLFIVFCLFIIIQPSRQTAISLRSMLKKTTTFASRQILSLTIFPLHFIRRWNFYLMPSYPPLARSFALSLLRFVCLFASQFDFSPAYVCISTRKYSRRYCNVV